MSVLLQPDLAAGYRKRHVSVTIASNKSPLILVAKPVDWEFGRS